jgi:hypothetical protein
MSSNIMPGNNSRTGFRAGASFRSTVGEPGQGEKPDLSSPVYDPRGKRSGKRVQTVNNLFTYCKQYVHNLYTGGKTC